MSTKPIGEKSGITVGITITLVLLAFACGKLWNRVDTVEAAEKSSEQTYEQNVTQINARLGNLERVSCAEHPKLCLKEHP